MARTPLMSRFVGMASDFHEADARGISVDRVRAERRGISRRDFLVTSGGAALAFGLLGDSAITRAASAPRIAIVGGGISGLNAALTLQDAGYASTIYEAAPDVGGRMHSNTSSWANGQTSEWCGELIDTGHKTILHLAQRFGLATADLVGAQPNGSEDTYYFFGKYYLQSQADKDFQPVHQVLQGQVQAASYPTLYNSYTSAGYQLDHISVYDWIEQYVAGGHSSPMGQLLDVAYNIEYGRETREQSSLNLVYLLGYQAGPGNFSIFGASDERYHIVGGNQRLPRAIESRLTSASPRCTVQLSSRMTAIARNADGTLTLTVSTPTGTRQATYDRVILTLPFSVLRTLDYNRAGFDSLKKTAITQLGYGTNSKLQLQFATRFWNGKGAWPNIADGTIYTDIGFQNTWDVTRAQTGPTGIIVDYTGGKAGAAYKPSGPYTTTGDSTLVQQYAQQFLAQLEKVWPGATAHYTGTATLSYPTGDPNLLGSYSCWKVGQYTQFSGYEKARQGKIHFGGEHCSQDFQGFMEGGASEGVRAANEILTDYKAGIVP